MGITIDSLVTLLNRRATVFAAEINTTVRQGLELEAELMPKSSTGDYIAPNMTVTEVFQGFQCNWLPKNSENLTALTISQNTFMANLQWSCTDIIKFQTEFGDMMGFAQANTQPLDWTLPQYLYEKLYLPKMREELNANSFTGVYVAPTSGTASASAATANGWLTVLASLIAGNKVTPIYNTTVLTSANILAKLDAFVQVIPIPERQAGGVIRCSVAVYELALRAFVSAYGTNFAAANAFGMNYEMKLPFFPNVTLKAYVGMGTSQRLIFKPTNFEPMAYVVNPVFGGAYPTGYWFHEPKNGIVGYRVELSRGYGFLHAERVYCNEQP